jgi:BirA family transcriptional regulator, biotin operon repressor / biotin---[acetyl-CoA-carboxylase] ligase
MSASISREPLSEWARLMVPRIKTEVVGHPFLAYDELDSTQDIARSMAVDGAPEGLTIVARTQKQGRGRRGRSWLSIPGEGVYMSVLLRPNLPSVETGWLAVAGGVAVVKALVALGVRDVWLKWPNDVLVGGKKIAGVLVEPRLGSASIDFAVVGIGVNVRQHAREWTDALKEIATSCLMEGVDVSCDDVTLAVLEQLDGVYASLGAREYDLLMKTWAQYGGTSEMPVID